jgi:GTP-binding protein YchF
LEQHGRQTKLLGHRQPCPARDQRGDAIARRLVRFGVEIVVPRARIERRIVPLEKKAKNGDKEARAQIDVMTPLLAALRAGRPGRSVAFDDEEQRRILRTLGLMTTKPVVYACNVEESSAATGNAHSERVAAFAAAEGNTHVVISAAIEAEIAQLGSDAERAEFLETLGLAETGLTRVIRAGYELLGLVTFFTVGPKEARAWTVERGAKAPNAAGVIHTDFERGFIRAETIAYDDFVACGGESGAREAGKLRLEGKEYVVQDGDIFHFLFNV